MADNLTVGSPGAGNLAPEEAPKEKRVDDGRAELERLRQIAKERGGKTLDDRTLSAIVERHKAKIAQATQNKEIKQAFETGRGKETVTSKANEVETRTAKATGTQETRTADGLSERDRTAVRADPKAGPRLPPSDAKPATPEQAKALVLKLLESFLQTNGKPLDLPAYAASLTPRQPTQPKGEGTIRPPGTTLGKTSSSQTTRPATMPPTGSVSRPGLGKPAGGTSLSFRTSAGLGASTGTGVSGSGLINTGGGLKSHSSFDAMHFNWDGFFALFLIRSQKDMQEWRKMMKELRAAEGQATIAAHDAQIALLQMRQQFARQASVSDFSESLTDVQKAMKKDAVTAVLQGRDPKRAQELREKMAGLVAQARGRTGASETGTPRNPAFHDATAEGQVYLTQSQIKLLSDTVTPPATKSPRQQYQDYLKEFQQVGGAVGYAVLVEDAAALAAGPPPLAVGPPPNNTDPMKELRNNAREARATLMSDIAALMQDPRQAALVNQERMQLRQQERQALSRYDAAKAKADKDPTDVKAVNERDAAHKEQASLLRQIVALDRAMADSEPHKPERDAAYEKAHTVLQTQADNAQADVDKKRIQHALSYQKTLIESRQPDSTDDFNPLGRLNEPGNDTESMNDLAAAAEAGDEISKQRAGLYHDLDAEHAIETVGKAFRDLAQDQNMQRAVENAVQGAIAVASKNRGETDALMRETVARSQGMINQLIQLLGMSRSH